MNNLVASKDEVSKMTERTVSTIKNIKDLQDLEKSLYSQLENSASSSSPPSLQEQEKAGVFPLGQSMGGIRAFQTVFSRQSLSPRSRE